MGFGAYITLIYQICVDSAGAIWRRYSDFTYPSDLIVTLDFGVLRMNTINLSIYIFLFTEKWFLRRKIRQWARLLDADQDGVISQEDMRITNEKLERLRRMIGARQTALSPEDQQKWWNDNVFKCGPGKSISVEDYMAHLLEQLGLSKSPEMASKIRPVIKGWFKFFTTEDYMKRNLIIGEYDFIRFWSILAEYVPESHCKKMFIKNFPTPFTMDSFLEDFVSFVSNPDFYDEYSNRVYNVIKPRPSGMCEQV